VGCVAKLSRASTLENCAQSTSAKFHFIPSYVARPTCNQPTNKSANQTVWGDDCGPGRIWSRISTCSGLVRLDPSWKVAIIAPRRQKNTRKRQATALARPATHCLSVCLVIIFSPSRGKKQANHVLPQPCRRRRALRFLGQCLHVSFWDTASTDAIYLCARVWREQVG